MKRGLMLCALAAAIACGSSAGDVMNEAFDDMTDVPGAGAQDDSNGIVGPQGEPGPQGAPGHPVVFCADFGAFCGFSAETLASMSGCTETISQLDDDGTVCTARNLQAAKSGDTGGCAAIANLDPCGFVPAPAEPDRKAIVDVVTIVPDAQPYADDTHPYPWFCKFDSSNTIAVQDGNLFLFHLDGEFIKNTNWYTSASVAYRAAGDSSDGTILDEATLQREAPFTQQISKTSVSAPLVAGTYEVGICVKQSAYCSGSAGCGYFARLEDGKVTTLVVNLD